MRKLVPWESLDCSFHALEIHRSPRTRKADGEPRDNTFAALAPICLDGSECLLANCTALRLSQTNSHGAPGRCISDIEKCNPLESRRNDIRPHRVFVIALAYSCIAQTSAPDEQLQRRCSARRLILAKPARAAGETGKSYTTPRQAD